MCPGSLRARVLRSAVDRVAEADNVVGTMDTGTGPEPLPRGAGMPPSTAVHGRVDAMALDAGTGVGAVTDIRPAADVIADPMAHLAEPAH